MYELSQVKNNWSRADNLQQWHEGGGIMILSYEMYRNLSQHKFIKKKKQKDIITECLVNPGMLKQQTCVNSSDNMGLLLKFIAK